MDLVVTRTTRVAVALVLALLAVPGAALAAPADTALVSRASGAGGAPLLPVTYAFAGRPAMSNDGRYVAFTANRGTVDSPRMAVYVRDTGQDTTELVSVAANGDPANSDAIAPSISADGRFVAFESFATNLDAGKLDGGYASVFVRDRQTQATILAARDSDAGATPGTPMTTSTGAASISGNGRYVAFTQAPAGPGLPGYVWVRDLVDHTTTLASRADGEAGAAGNKQVSDTAITPDGRYVAYTSFATNLGLASSTSRQVYLRDMVGFTTRLVSRATGASGVASNTGGHLPSISADGRYVSFGSQASNLSPERTTLEETDVFVRDVVNDTLAYVPAHVGDPFGPVNAGSALSPDGSHVAYELEDSSAPDPSLRQVVIRDLGAPAAPLVVASRASGDSGAQGNANSSNPALSADGDFAAFSSVATNLAAGVAGTFTRDLRAEIPGGDPPQNTALPELTVPGGGPRSGQTLTASTGGWLNDPQQFAYGWRRCDAAGGSCTAIGGATAGSYVVTDLDVGATLRVSVTATNVQGSREASSLATMKVLAATVSIAPPAISGAAVHGETLAASNGSWDVAPTAYSYRWERCDAAGAACVAIDGAAASTYVSAAADVGHALRVEVAAQVAGGSAKAESAPSAPIGRSVKVGASPGSVDFGTVRGFDRGPDRAVTITNAGLDATRITDYLVVGDAAGRPFSTRASDCAQRTLQGGESCAIPLAFTAPAAGGAVGDRLLVSYADGPALSIPLTARVTSPGEITGRVLDGDAGDAPVADALVYSNALARPVRTDAGGVFHVYYRDLLLTAGAPYLEVWSGQRTTTAVVAVDRARAVTVAGDLRLFTAAPPPDGVEIFSPWGRTHDGIPVVDATAPWSAKLPLRIDLTGEPGSDPVQAMVAGIHAPGGGFEAISIVFFVTYYDAAGNREGISNFVFGRLECGPAGQPSPCADMFELLNPRRGTRSLRACVPTSPSSKSPTRIEILPPENAKETFRVLIRGADDIALMEAVPFNLNYIAKAQPGNDPTGGVPMLLGALSTGALLGSSPEQRYAYAVALATGDLGADAQRIARQNFFDLTAETPGLEDAIHGQVDFWYSQQEAAVKGRKSRKKEQPPAPCKDPAGGGGGGGGGGGSTGGGGSEPGGGTIPGGSGGGGKIYIDPSGRVESTKRVPLNGATVTLRRADTVATPLVAVPNGSDLMAPSNRRNPDRTGLLGLFAWDVQPGFYRVDATHPKCAPASTGRLEVPPPRLHLVIRLRCKSLRLAKTRTIVRATKQPAGGAALRATVMAARGRARPPRSKRAGTVTFRTGKRVIATVAITADSATAVVLVPARKKLGRIVTATFDGNGALARSTGRARVPR